MQYELRVGPGTGGGHAAHHVIHMDGGTEDDACLGQTAREIGRVCAQRLTEHVQESSTSSQPSLRKRPATHASQEVG